MGTKIDWEDNIMGKGFIFDNPIGSISEPVKMYNEIIVIEIAKEKVAGYKPFDEVSENIKKNLVKDKKIEYATKMLSDQSWPDESIDITNSVINILQNQTGIIKGSFSEIGTCDELIGALLALEKNETSKIINTYNIVCKIKMNSKDEFDEDKYMLFLEDSPAIAILSINKYE